MIEKKFTMTIKFPCGTPLVIDVTNLVDVDRGVLEGIIVSGIRHLDIDADVCTTEEMVGFYRMGDSVWNANDPGVPYVVLVDQNPENRTIVIIPEDGCGKFGVTRVEVEKVTPR